MHLVLVHIMHANNYSHLNRDIKNNGLSLVFIGRSSFETLRSLFGNSNPRIAFVSKDLATVSWWYY